MKAVYILLFFSFSLAFGQEKPSELNQFQFSTYDETLIPFDTEKRLFYDQNTVFVEKEFERSYKRKIYREGKGSKVAKAGATLLARGTLFFIERALQSLLTPKPKRKSKKDNAERGKGIKN